MLENQDTISKSHLATARAVDQLRRQLGIVLQEDDGVLLGAVPIEGLTPGLLRQLQILPEKRLHLLLTSARAHSLGIDIGSQALLRIDAQNLSLPTLLALADPLNTSPLPEIKPLPATPSQQMLLSMAKYASLLPAMLTVESNALPQDWLPVIAADVASYWAAPQLDIVPLAQAKMPMEGAENAKLMCFRTRYGTSTHLALIIGDPAQTDAPLTRIHSSCITGDILGSMRCDCGDQLHRALEQIKQAGNGVLIYLHQEGRGIGIANKLRAYQLQERGLDTYDANLALGFGEDERDFAIAGAILKHLNIRNIRLLTNNPLKITAIEKTGITVTERVPLIIPSGSHNKAYLEAKGKKAGHLF